MKQYIVVAYDIVDDNRRNKIADILSAYGQRVNKSVFECFLRQKDISELKRKIRAHVKKDEDIVLYYCLCRECLEKIDRTGAISEEKQVVISF
ncbi:MAG: CRISPR-associated endonuclease Cas2 [Nitrospirota bacterium]